MTRLPLLLAPAAGLAFAIAAMLPAPAAADRYNREVGSVHQPVVQRSDYVLDVAAAPLSAGAQAKVLGWFDAIGLGYGDRISIDTTAAGSEAGSAPGIAGVTALVARYGLLVANGAPVTEGAIPAGYLRIVVSRSTASVPGCPDFSQPSQPNFTASTSSNFGCAMNSTLAAMVANPEDLVRGAEARGSDARVATKAIKAWREAEPTAKSGLKNESTKGN
jgi:pilus assembly protein CpaD